MSVEHLMGGADMSNVPPDKPDEPEPWGSSPTWGPGGWAGGQTEPPQPPYGQEPYGQQPPPFGQQVPPAGGFGQGLPSYGQFGGPQANWGSSPAVPGELASWGQRALGWLVDALIVAVPTIVLYAIGDAGKVSGLAVVGVLYGVVMGIWFSVQVGRYGGSPGMRMIGLRCVHKNTGQPVGGGMGFVRGLLHGVAWAVCGVLYIVDMLWPLWDGLRQTLADKIVSTVVIKVPPEPFSLVPRRR